MLVYIENAQMSEHQQNFCAVEVLPISFMFHCLLNFPISKLLTQQHLHCSPQPGCFRSFAEERGHEESRREKQKTEGNAQQRRWHLG